MNHHIIASLLLLSFTSGALAQELHLVTPGVTVQTSVSPTDITQRVEAAAKKYEQYAPVPRFGLYDIAYPLNETEYAATSGSGVALVVIYTQQRAELPLRRLFLRSAGEMADLKLISSAFSEVESTSIVSRVFGAYRWEGLYLFPTRLQRVGTELVADYQINRTGFVLAKFQESGLTHTPGATDAVIAPSITNQTALLGLVSREYPGFTSCAPAPEAVMTSPPRVDRTHAAPNAQPIHQHGCQR